MYKKYLMILILLVLIDIPMITLINKTMYQKQFMRINKDDMKSNKETIIAGILCYLLLALGIYYFVISYDSSQIDVFIRGMILGLVVYGVYNTTNRFSINEYGTYESIVDTVWGSLLIGTVSLLVNLLS